ncbi:MAG: DUF3833 domain-containing protein [Alphaproteobacteria bacterium]|nr:DUF3833 domain-containing protein [Alphaproteobacteria bacterium]
MKNKLWMAASAAITFLTACSGTMKPEDFKGTEPRFVIEKYFSGETKAWGMFEDRFGTLRRQFVVDITGTWDGTQLVLDERFAYSDGEKDRRVWTITKVDDNTYTGTASDVIGTAQGRSFGNTLNWSYDLNLKVGDGTWKVHFDDWMYLQPGNVLLNKAVVTKFGVHIGTVTLAFNKPLMAANDQNAFNEMPRAAE